MWKGKWHPAVFQFSSNWKELQTLHQLLLLLIKEGKDKVKGTKVFHFTDNSGVNWISASGASSSLGLHALIEDICLLELELECFLEVVHIPGRIIIEQGTDGLS